MFVVEVKKSGKSNIYNFEFYDKAQKKACKLISKYIEPTDITVKIYEVEDSDDSYETDGSEESEETESEDEIFLLTKKPYDRNAAYNRAVKEHKAMSHPKGGFIKGSGLHYDRYYNE